ncbi:MAG: polysaccharide deacetylase family protein [Verrucomicrobiota bacterium]
MTRFHLSLIVAALLGAAVWASGHGLYWPAVLILLFVFTALGVIFPEMRWFGPIVCTGKTDRRWVALTFDDGPDPRSTPALLDLLKTARIPATFFCIGNRIDAHPELAAQIVREGHLLQNHSYTHSYRMNLFSRARLRDELSRTQIAIKKTTGRDSNWYRPPMGLTNPRIFRVARSLGLAVIGWNARSLDTKITQPEKILARIERRLQPGGIILLHDGNIPVERLLPTVKMLLDRLNALGYEVVRLDQML